MMGGTLLVALACTALAASAPQVGTPPRPPAPPADQESCRVCHGKEGLELDRSAHAHAGVGCVACHGGASGPLDKEDAHGDDLTALSDPLEAVERCGGCHSDPERMRRFGTRTDQLALYWTSRHGEVLRETGSHDVATCVSCHGPHEILPATDPRSSVHKTNQLQTCATCHANAELMGPYGLRTDVGELYRDSVHGRALIDEGRMASPGCADCHGSHGALPPRVDEVSDVCGACHSVARDFFEGNPHQSAALTGDAQRCVACHGNHGVREPSAEMFVGDEQGHCGSCHQEDGDPARQVARTLYETLASLDSMIEGTQVALQEAASKGLFIEREHGYLDDARGLRARARTMTHALSPAALDDVQNRCQGMIAQTLESLDIKSRALRDRKIFTAIFFGVVLLLVGVLSIHRRAIAGRSEGTLELHARRRPSDAR